MKPRVLGEVFGSNQKPGFINTLSISMDDSTVYQTNLFDLVNVHDFIKFQLQTDSNLYM